MPTSDDLRRVYRNQVLAWREKLHPMLCSLRHGDDALSADLTACPTGRYLIEYERAVRNATSYNVVLPPPTQLNALAEPVCPHCLEGEGVDNVCQDTGLHHMPERPCGDCIEALNP